MRRWLQRPPARACGFCDRHALTSKNRVVFEDERVVAIEDINPRAQRHFLVISTEHIPSADELTVEDIELVKHMIQTGRHLLAVDGFTDPSTYQLGFHRPPFTSVAHLHLHCLAFPFLPFWNQLRYTPSVLGNYIDATAKLSDLEAQRHNAIER